MYTVYINIVCLKHGLTTVPRLGAMTTRTMGGGGGGGKKKNAPPRKIFG